MNNFVYFMIYLGVQIPFSNFDIISKSKLCVGYKIWFIFIWVMFIELYLLVYCIFVIWKSFKNENVNV